MKSNFFTKKETDLKALGIRDAELVEAYKYLIFSCLFDRINDQKALLSQPLFVQNQNPLTFQQHLIFRRLHRPSASSH